MLVLAIALAGCSSKTKSNETDEASKLESVKEVHERDLHGSGEGEESGTQLGLDEVYDAVRKGTHLVLSYDAQSNSFVGTVENVSEQMLDRVRIEVHLSNGTELGPTTQVELKPGEQREVSLAAESTDFKGWSTHAEVGSGEHSHEGESGHEHN